MVDDPMGDPTPDNKKPPGQADSQSEDAGHDNPSIAGSPGGSADSATARPSTEDASGGQYSFEDFKKQVAQNAGQPGWLNEFARAMHEHRGSTINIHIRDGGVDIHAPTQIGGDLAGNDAVKRGAASSTNRAESGISGQLYGSEVEKIVSVYVETAAHQRAYKILSEKHLLILCGDADTGKRSAAVCLLESFHRETIFEIAPTLEELTDFQGQHGQGYLWHTPSAEKISRLSCYALDQISREHGKLGSHLVITLTKGARIAPEVARQYLLEWNSCPDGAQVLDNHLRWHLEKESAQVGTETRTLRQREEIGVLISSTVRRPSQAGRLAELLIQVARGELSLEELLMTFADLNRQDVQTWFERHPQLHQHLQMVALAVLHGASFQQIITASNALRARLAAEELLEADGAVAIAEAELTTGIRQWLSEFEAKIVVREISAQYGRSTVEAVVFKNPQFQAAVLAYAWRELQHWRTALLKWLVEIGSSDGLENRIAAAVALSELSQYHAFDDVLREAVSLWAKAGEPSLRRLAAFILMLQALEKNLSAQVLGLLHHWSKTRNNPRLQWTAATAFGTELGLKYPELAVRDLQEVFLSRNLDLHVSVLATLKYLFESGRQEPRLFKVVLQTLEIWAGDQRLMKQNVLYIFWELLRSRVRVDGNSWPTILRLAVLDEMYERQFCSLLSAALTDKEIRGLLLDDLKEWLVAADKMPEMYKLLGRVLYFLFKSKGASLNVVCRIIAERLERWEANEQSQSAGKLLAVLKGKFSV